MNHLVRSAGKLIGPDGQEMDNEAFLSNLVLYTTNSTRAANLNTSTFTPLLFRVVTQKYGRGIVDYGSTTQTVFQRANTSTTGNGGSFYDICNASGVIYLEIDTQVPACIACGQSTPDGYSGASLTNSAWSGQSTIQFAPPLNVDL